MAPDVNPELDACWRRIGVGGDASCPELPGHVHCRNCPSHSSAASALLSRAPPDDYLAEWTGHVARGRTLSGVSLGAPREGEGEAAAPLSLMIFRVAGEWLALPTRVLEEVTEPSPLHTLPHRRSGVVLGVTNIHGALLICVSLAMLLGLAPEAAPRQNRPGAAKRRMLVIGRDSGRFVFPADEVHGIHRCGPGALRPAPATVARAAGGYTREVLPWQGRMVGCLEPDLLLDSLNRNVA
jgi:chemotaxis-related protein WspD